MAPGADRETTVSTAMANVLVLAARQLLPVMTSPASERFTAFQEESGKPGPWALSLRLRPAADHLAQWPGNGILQPEQRNYFKQGAAAMSNRKKLTGTNGRYVSRHRKEPSWTIGDLAGGPGGLAPRAALPARFSKSARISGFPENGEMRNDD